MVMSQPPVRSGAVHPDVVTSSAFPSLSADDVAVRAWLADMQHRWHQGEHVVIIGQTGSGKTTLARDLLCIRDYVIVLAVKRHDDTIDSFKSPSTRLPTDATYKVIHKWPPSWDCNRAVIWLRPEHLRHVGEQALETYRVLDRVFVSGGWCIYVDDTGYVTGTLKLHAALTVLLNQGRSSHISVVSALTQPSSIVARVPSETLRQARHKLVFRYGDDANIEAIARITGSSKADLRALMADLDDHDFLAFHQMAAPIIVRNTR